MNIGERLKMARKMRGLSQEDLSIKVGVSRMAISKYERDIIAPKSQVLIKLAHALEVKVEFLMRPLELNLSAPVFRKRKSLPKKQENKILEQARDWIERYIQVESLFGGPVYFKVPSIDFNVKKLSDIEEIAKNLREEWKLGLDPIDNLVEIIEHQGIKIWIMEWEEEKFDALQMWVNKKSPVIVIKEGIPGDRQRFNLAHELGHLLLKIDDDIDEEKAANRFAGAFLVPNENAYEELGKYRQNIGVNELLMLKHKYGVSMHAWLFRAKDLEIISDSKAKSYFISMRKNKWHVEEPGKQIEPEYPQRMQQLILRAISENVISRIRGKELLNQPLPIVERFEF